MALGDLLLFLREWIRHPLRTAAIKPSSPALADLITREISARTGKVLELGPGTGVFTKAIIGNGVREENVTLIERSEEFAKLLRKRFPDARTLGIDAEKLEDGRLYDGSPVGAVICGLGLLNMPHEKIFNIMKGAFSYLKADGEFFLFTYGSGCPIPQMVLVELGLTTERVGKTYMNVPPASVYRITRQAWT